MLVTVLDENEAPTARVGVYNKIPVVENSPIGTVIPWIYQGQTNQATVTSLSGEISDEDASESFTFLLTPTRPAKNKFAITSNTGILSVASDQLNHDMPTKDFKVHVKVIDSGGLQLTNNAEGKVELNFYITGKYQLGPLYCFVSIASVVFFGLIFFICIVQTSMNPRR